MNTVPQTTDIIQGITHDNLWKDGFYVHRQLRPLFDVSENINVCGDGMPLLLPEGHHLWIDQYEERLEKAEAIGDNFYVIRVYDLGTGEQINAGVKLGNEWWEQQLGDYDYARFGRMFPNTYVVNEKYLFVSCGMWSTEDHPDEDGMGRFVSSFSVRAEEHRRRSEWLDYRADSIAAVQPSWAYPDETWVDPDEGDTIEFSRTIGTVKIEQAFHVDGDNFTPDSDAEVRVIAGATDYCIFAGTEIMDVGMDLIRAGQILYGPGNVSVSIFEIVGRELGVSPGDVYQLGEKG